MLLRELVVQSVSSLAPGLRAMRNVQARVQLFFIIEIYPEGLLYEVILWFCL